MLEDVVPDDFFAGFVEDFVTESLVGRGSYIGVAVGFHMADSLVEVLETHYARVFISRYEMNRKSRL